MKLFDFFLKPDWLWNILWIVPLFIGVSLFSASKRKRFLRMILGERAESPDTTNLSKVKRRIRTILAAVAAIFVVVAAARPFWGNEIIPWSGYGRDIMIVLDVSRSMLAEDVKPSRLEHSKWFVKELLKATPGDRYGLVAFSGSAFLQCPMTIDKTSFFQILDEMRPGIIPLGGTNIQNALEVALKAFQAAEGTHRAIVLITDGDELQGDMSLMIKELNEKKIPIYVVGVGDPSQPALIMVSDEKTGKKVFLKDKSGELAKSALNERYLAKFATECQGGIYVRSTATSPNLDPVLDKIKNLVPEKHQSGQNTRPIERFHIPLLVAVLLLMLSLCIGEIRASSALVLLLVFCSNHALFSQSSLSAAIDQDAHASPPEDIPATNKNDAKNPAETGASKEKLAPFEIFNEGLEKHRANDREKAIELYQKAINASSGDNAVRARAYQNMGVIVHEQGREMLKSMELDKAKNIFEEAQELYRDAMAFSETPSKDMAMNQQKLLNDLRLLEELKKQQKEMQDKKQEAQQKIQEAQKENEEAKQTLQSKKDEQQQSQNQKKQDANEQKQKPQSADSQSNENQEQKQANGQTGQRDKSDDAKEKTEQAKKSVEDYKKQAENLNSQKDKELAENAQKQIEEAIKNQQNKDFDKAGDNLEKALQALADSRDDKKNDDKTGEQNEMNAQKKDAQKDENSDDNQQAKGFQHGEAKEKKDDEIDAEQAEALLDLMERDEKSFRNEIRESNRRASDIKEVEKDW